MTKGALSESISKRIGQEERLANQTAIRGCFARSLLICFLQMSAAELLEQAKLLSGDERERLIESLLELEMLPKAQPQSQTIEWPDTLERAKRICGERVLPNMVLEERESYNY
jgi:hypothetical protein